MTAKMDTMAELVAAYEAGASLRELATSQGIDPATMRKRLAEAGARIRPAGRPRSLPDASLGRELAAAYRAGATLRALGEQYGVSEGTIMNRLVAMGVPRRPTAKALSLDDEAIRVAYRAGESMEEISQRLGVSASAVRARLLRAGEELRPVGAPRALPELFEADAALTEAYAAGASLETIAEQTDASVGAVRRRLQSLGVEMRPAGGQSPLPNLPEVNAALLDACGPGVSLRGLAAELGVTRTALRRRLLELGVSIEPRKRGLLLASEAAPTDDTVRADTPPEPEREPPAKPRRPNAPKKLWRQLDSKQEAALVRARLAGEHPDTLVRFGVSLSTVYRILRRAGVKSEPRPPAEHRPKRPERDYDGPRVPHSPEVIEALVEAWRGGASIRSLAIEIDASRKEVATVLRAAGIDTAARSTAATRTPDANEDAS